MACAGMCQNSLLGLGPWLYDVRLLDVQLSLNKLQGFVDQTMRLLVYYIQGGIERILA